MLLKRFNHIIAFVIAVVSIEIITHRVRSSIELRVIKEQRRARVGPGLVVAARHAVVVSLELHLVVVGAFLGPIVQADRRVRVGRIVGHGVMVAPEYLDIPENKRTIKTLSNGWCPLYASLSPNALNCLCFFSIIL